MRPVKTLAVRGTRFSGWRRSRGRPGPGGWVLQCDVVTGMGDDGAADVGCHLCWLPGYLVPEIGMGADGRDRAADRAGVTWPVLLGVDWAGAVYLQDRSGAAGALDPASETPAGETPASETPAA
jgi:hypothetical protein